MTNFWDRITGNDTTKEMRTSELRTKKLSADYQEAWERINLNLWPRADPIGRNLMPIFDDTLGLPEEGVADGESVREVSGDDIRDFCSPLADEGRTKSMRDRWRERLNYIIAKELGKQEDAMSIQGITESKKERRTHMACVKSLPQEYQIVYKEIQEYPFRVDSVEMVDGITDGTGLFSGIVDLFEEGAASGKGASEVTGRGVTAFCDDLTQDSRTSADTYQEPANRDIYSATKKDTDKKGGGRGGKSN